MQCRRPWLPQVDAPVAFATAAALPGAVLADAGGAPVALDQPTVLVGPEGGWSDAEREMLEGAGAEPLALGGRVLRAETAVLVGLTLVQHWYGDLMLGSQGSNS